MKQVRLIVVEDNRLLREGLSAMLREQSDIAVIGAVANGEGLSKMLKGKVDVVLLEPEQPGTRRIYKTDEPQSAGNRYGY